MTPFDRDRWSEIEPLLDEALDLPDAAARGEWLVQLRERSPELAEAVAEFLAKEAGPQAAWLDSGSALHQGGEPGLAGQAMGKYTLEEPIGRGGMGSVWLAHRSDGRFEGKVAVKLLNLALVGRAAGQRFVTEGTALARLHHPNIATLLDAGISDIGQPYLVLEYIDGERLDAYADSRRLAPRQRISLFLEVLKAVAAAHASLVVHRDIKPSNVMVARDGTVKLLDFGIAKLLDEGRPADRPVTETGHRAFTPEFAAPEVMLGQPVTTATDVYSLGVMLYLLLSGRHPTGIQFETAAAAILAAVNTDPLRLSDAVTPDRTAEPGTTERDAAARSTTAQKLRRLYLGDLDNILGKALKKAPGERYQTATAFADDLERYLTDQPVSARADSWGYRSRKFTRRHRAALVAAAVAVLALVGGMAFSVRQMTIAGAQRDRAQDALRRSAASVSFETLLFRVMDQGGRSFTYQELLDRAREALEKEYRGDPVSRIQLTIQFAQSYLRRDDPVTAISVLEGSMAIADSIGAPEWQGRTRCELAIGFGKVGQRHDSALALIRSAQGFLSRVPQVEKGTLDACDSGAGDAWLNLDQPDSAALAFRRVTDRYVASGDTLSENYLFALNDAARALFVGGRSRDAGAVVVRILETSRQGNTSDPWSRIAAIVNIETVHMDLGEYQTNRRFLGAVIADSTGIDSVASRDPFIMSRYARLQLRLGQLDSARYWMDRALLGEEDLGPVWGVEARTTAAELALRQGDMARFEEHRAAVERMTATREPDRRLELAYLRILSSTDSGGALAAKIRTTLEGVGFGEGKPRQDRLLMHLLVAAERLSAAQQFQAARGYAGRAAELAVSDSLSRAQSARLGQALVLRARAELGLGDVAAGRASVRAALLPLQYGMGAGHPQVVAATALRDSVGR